MISFTIWNIYIKTQPPHPSLVSIQMHTLQLTLVVCLLRFFFSLHLKFKFYKIISQCQPFWNNFPWKTWWHFNMWILVFFKKRETSIMSYIFVLSHYFYPSGTPIMHMFDIFASILSIYHVFSSHILLFLQFLLNIVFGFLFQTSSLCFLQCLLYLVFLPNSSLIFFS